MTRAVRRLLGLVAALAAVGMVSGCAETSDGRPVSATTGGAASTLSSSSPATSPSPSTSVDIGPPTMGVVPTIPDTVPPNALACLSTPAPGTPVTARIVDDAAPRITLSLPEGWTAAPGQGGVAVALTGPDGMSGRVDVTETKLDPVAAFDKYSNDITAGSPISSVSVMPADFCGYSGQRMMGLVDGGDQGNRSFEDRVTHIWTNTNDYLIAIHVGAPPDTAGFDAATSVLLADFSITIP